MTTTERTVQHTMTHEFVIEKDKCTIQITVYSNEDLKIVLENLTSKDLFQYDENAMGVETLTTKCKAIMTSLEFYNLIESVFEEPNNLNSYTFSPLGDNMLLTFFVNMPMAHGKSLVRTLSVILIKQEQRDVDRIVKMMRDLNCDKELILNMKHLIDEFPKMLDDMKTSALSDTNAIKLLLAEWKKVMDKLIQDVGNLETQSALQKKVVDDMKITQLETNDDIESVVTDLTETKSTIKTMSTQLDEMKMSALSETNAMKTVMDMLGEDVAKQKTVVDAMQITQLEAEEERMSVVTDLVSTKSTIKTMSTQLDDMKTVMETLGDDVEDLETEVAKQKTVVDAMQISQLEAEEERMSVVTDLAETKSTIKTMSTQLDDMKTSAVSDAIEMKKVMDKLSQDVGNLETKIVTQKTMVDDIQVTQLESHEERESVITDLAKTKSTIKTMINQIEAITNEIIKARGVPQGRSCVAYISLSKPVPITRVMEIGNYTKKFQNSDLIIEAYMRVSGFAHITFNLDFCLGYTTGRAQYVSLLQEPTTTLTFIGQIIGNNLSGSQPLSLKIDKEPFDVLSPNDTGFRGVGQTVSIFKITETRK